jgi:hypothetical protein
MTATVRNINAAMLHMVDQPVFFIDPAAVFPVKVSAQCFRFSNTLEAGVSLNVLD